MSIAFTQSGIDELKIELEDIKSKRPAIIKELQRAREMGDLSENGLYKATKGQLLDTDRRIRQIVYLIKNAKIESSLPSTSTISIGNTVELESNGKKFTYQIVGTYESDPSKGKISVESPLGRLLQGKKIDDEVILKRDTDTTYKIISIK